MKSVDNPQLEKTLQKESFQEILSILSSFESDKMKLFLHCFNQVEQQHSIAFEAFDRFNVLIQFP